MAGRPGERLRAAVSAVAGEPDAPPGRLIAVGWATVDLDRAVAELAADLGTAGDAFAPVAGSVALGAYCRIARGVLLDDIRLVVLEPSTEGRLAERLARHDEGPAALWFAVVPATDPTAVATDPPDARLVAGPLGPERVIARSAAGLERFLVEPVAGTIHP